MADWPADRGVVIREPRGYRARAELLARRTHYQPVKFPEESLEMLNDADCSIDHVITAGVFEHVRWDDLALREIVCRKGAAIADGPAGAIRFEREWPR